jgi:hypothetical protein
MHDIPNQIQQQPRDLVIANRGNAIDNNNSP